MKTIRTSGEGKKRLEHALKNLDGKVGKVGWFQSAKYNDKNATNVAYVAAIHEFGVPEKNIPARSFMRPTISEKSNEWRDVVHQLAVQVLKGELTIEQVMDGIGLKAAGDIREAIATLTSPAIKDATIKARTRKYADKSISASSKPLVDTKVLLNTLTNMVEKK